MTTFTELGSLLETRNSAGQTIRGLMEVPALQIPRPRA